MVSIELFCFYIGIFSAVMEFESLKNETDSALGFPLNQVLTAP